jgi:hypothetical protein
MLQEQAYPNYSKYQKSMEPIPAQQKPKVPTSQSKDTRTRTLQMYQIYSRFVNQ